MARHRSEPLSTSAPGLAGSQLDAFDDVELRSRNAAELDVPAAGRPQARDAAESHRVAARENSIWVSLANGEQLHLRHLLPLSGAADNEYSEAAAPGLATENPPDSSVAGLPLLGRSVFMLHGEAECGRVFYDGERRGLASYLLDRGCEVFIADLGGRGRSLVPGGGRASTIDVPGLINEAIPALLAAAREHSELALQRGPDVWVAHGFGTVLLAACWARLPVAQRSAAQWIFFAGRRRFNHGSRRAALFTKFFCHPLFGRLVEWRKVFPATRMGLGTADENAAWYRHYARWMLSGDWRCADGFDYAAALADASVPPTLHLATAADPVFCNLQDVRDFIAELGAHDARLLVVDRIKGTRQRYSHLAMLLEAPAEQDIFAPLVDWLCDVDSRDNDAAADPQGSFADPQATTLQQHTAGESATVRSAGPVQVESYYGQLTARPASESARHHREPVDNKCESREGRSASRLASIS
ncbi:MAG: hypothetical protein WBN40_04415 [Pseudomonadales bacterium]